MGASVMQKIIVLYYSRTGATEAMAGFIAEGARSVGEVEVDVESVDGFNVDRLLEYDGIMMGSPTYYGTLAYEAKKLIDESVKHHGSLSGKVGGAFSSAANIGGGNETTILSILSAWLIHGMIIQGTEIGDHYGPVSIGAPDERATVQCKDIGKRIAELVKKV